MVLKEIVHLIYSNQQTCVRLTVLFEPYSLWAIPGGTIGKEPAC